MRPTKFYALYDIANNEMCIAIDTVKELSRKFKVNAGTVRSAVHYKDLLLGRYEVHSFNRSDLQ